MFFIYYFILQNGRLYTNFIILQRKLEVFNYGFIKVHKKIT